MQCSAKGSEILAGNAVVNGGINITAGVEGLDQLIHTNNILNDISKKAKRLNHVTANFTPHVNNAGPVNKIYNEVKKMRQGMEANVNFHQHGADEIKQNMDKFRKTLKSNVDFKLLGVDRAHHEIEYLDKPKHAVIHLNVNTGEIDNARQAFSRDNEAINHLKENLTAVGRDSGNSFGKISSNAEKAKQKTLSLSDAGHKIKGVFSGTFIGNAASQALGAISSGAKSAISSGIKLAESGDEAREAWSHIGVGNSNANAMVEQMDTLRDKAGLDEKSIQDLQKSFYTFTGSASQARSLTNEVSAFGKASGQSNQEIDRMGRTLPRMLSSGKVRAQMFNRTFGHSGELVNALAKASGRSGTAFRQLVNSGKLTSQQLQQYMSKAAKGSSKAWAQYDKTFKGQMQTIKGTWTESKEDFSKPFVNSLTKSLNQTEKSGTGLQKVQKSVAKITHSLGQKVGNFAGKAIGYIVKNQKALFRTGSALFKIVGELASGAWKTVTAPLRLIDNLFNLMAGRSTKAHHGLVTTSNILTTIAKHKTAIQALGGVLASAFAAYKFMKFAVAFRTIYKTFRKLKIIQNVVSLIKTLTSVTKIQETAQAALNVVESVNPFVAIGTAITALIAGLLVLFRRTKVVKTIFSVVGKVGAAAFKVITFPERMVLKLLGGIVKGVWNATSGLRHKLSGAFDTVKRHAEGFYNSALHNSNKWGHEFGSWITGNGWRYRKAQTANAHAASISHKAIDRYRKNSSGKFRAYIAKNGKIYRSYHKGTTRISETTYKQREALRSRYYRRYTSSLRKYEANYRKYESKRSSLSRKYGKLRAMYSQKSLDTVEKRFKSLRSTIVRYAKQMFTETQRWFRKLGTGAGKQFKGIYRTVRKYLRMSNREAVKDFKALNKDSTRWLDGSVNKYINELKRRFKSQKYYDGQLVKQAKKTGQSMYKLPLGWITRETKDLIRNWRRQRSSFITHNERMTHAETTHIHSMQNDLRGFSDHFEKIMSDMEDSIYDAWSKFWDKMHNRAGSGINSVQNPLNSGAEHINSFVKAFGETSSPMTEMPSVSYSTGTGFRKPITKMTDAVLNDGIDSPETNHQETVIKPNGQIHFPKGQNVHEKLEPGTEVLNATETKLLGQMAHFAPTVHFSSGTGLFGGLFNSMSSWVKSAIEGTNNGTSYDSLYEQAKGSGKTKLLHVLQAVLSKSDQVIASFMGNAPSGYSGVMNDITKGIYGQTTSQIDQWWKALMNLTNQTLNQAGSSSEVVSWAQKHLNDIPYSMGGESHEAADCSGMVDMALRHFGINLPRTTTAMENDPSQLQYVGKSYSDAKPGELALWGNGNGANGHVQLVASGGSDPQVFEETPPHSTTDSIKNTTSLPLHGFYKIKGINDSNNGTPSFKGASKGLMSFVKNQEKPYFQWIEKNLVPLLNPDPGGGPGVAKWRPIIKRAAEAMHVDLSDSGLNKVLSNIQHESNGDESVTQKVSDVNSAAGDPAIGLVQFIPPTFKNYAVSGHDNIRSGYDQLLALFNDSNWYSDIAPGGGWGPTGHRRMQSGGHMNAGEVATVGEQGEELFKPDNAGTIIPHGATKKILNSNNSKPVNIHQNITINANGAKSNLKQEIKSGVDRANDNLMEKLNRLAGNNEGGLMA